MTTWDRRKLATDVVTVVGAAVMVLWDWQIGPGLYGEHARSGALRVAIVAFPVADLVAFLGLCTVLLRGVGHGSLRWSLPLLTGLMAGELTDAYVTYQAVSSTHSSQMWATDVIGLASLALTGVGAIERCRTADDRRGAAAAVRPLRPYTYLPYLALAAGYLLLIVQAVRAGAFPWPGLVAGAAVMTGAVAVRQVMSLRENHLLVVTDSLTGLPNRLLLRERMLRATERADRARQPSAVLLIDLDGFKQVNDTHGHEAGDAVLVAFAGILRAQVRPTDTPARLGGDEFAVLLDGVHEQQDAVDVAERLLAEVGRGPVVTVAGTTLRVGCSIGISLLDPFDPDGVPDPHKQLRQADQAMYVAKKAHAGGWCVWSAELDDAVEHAAHVALPHPRHSGAADLTGPAGRSEP
jgi:diguanylate cyclase (GGDEF)-like protein